MFENIPFALTPPAFAELRSAVERASRGEEAVASFGRGALPPHAKGSHVAVIHVGGLLMKNPSPFMQKLGATSTAGIHEEFERAMQSPEVHSVLLHIDSPGGQVDGTQALADHIYNSRGRGKEIVAHVDGMGASAAYWIGSAAHKVYAATPSAQIGSVGVISSHADFSKALDNAGVKVTEVVSGAHKGLGSPNKPLGDDGKAEMQTLVDGLHAEFANHVAKARNLSKEQIGKVATGRVFLANQAKTLGLIDGIAPFTATYNALLAKSTKLAAGVKQAEAKAPPVDVAARARVWAAAEEKRTGRRISAAEAVAFIQSLV
jgi:signal peptide peptidase SppA